MNKMRRTNYPRGPIHHEEPIVQVVFETIHNKKYSYSSVASAAGVSVDRMWNIREGSDPKLSTISKIARALGYKLVLQRMD